MFRNTGRSFAMLAFVCYAASACVASDAVVCSELSGHFAGDVIRSLPDPSRKPTQAEHLLIGKSDIELLAGNSYSAGTLIVDADNDGQEDLFVWSTQGTGRYVYAELFDLRSPQANQAGALASKGAFATGILWDPRFVRYKEINYLVSTDTGDGDGLNIARIVKSPKGGFERQTICRMQTRLKPETSCRHPACKSLREVIGDEDANQSYVGVAWPHKYFPPAGLDVYFPEAWSNVDFDNTGQPTTLWPIGRQGYMYQHIYWTLIGQGEKMPEVDAKLRAQSEDKAVKRVLEGSQHDRLRRTLAEQSAVLSQQLHRPVSLPNGAEFFLFTANGDRTYWAWDFGEPPYGEEIHITYTNAKKSDYIGAIRIQRIQALGPCLSDCVEPLDKP